MTPTSGESSVQLQWLRYLTQSLRAVGRRDAQVLRRQRFRRVGAKAIQFPRLVIMLFCAVGCPSWAQNLTTTQQRLADLNFIATQLPALDPFFFNRLKPADFNVAVSQLSAQVVTLSDAQFYVGLTALVAMAGDPHTALYPNGSLNFQQFPLAFGWLDDGVFVTSASDQYSLALGMQLVAIGNSSLDNVLAALATIIPHANMQWVEYWGQRYLRGQQILQGLGILPPKTTSALTFQDRAGRQFTLQVSAGNVPMQSAIDPSQGPLPLYLQRSGLNYWYTYSPPLRMLFIKYTVCKDIAGYPFSAFAADVLAAFDANRVDTLVIDLRGNTGGDDALIDPLIDGVEQRMPAASANPYFRIYEVIDKGTFSSGSMDAMKIKSQIAAGGPGNMLTVIGEPTGGATGGPGNVQPFALPGSGIPGQYSTKMIGAPPGIPLGPAFLPDVPVARRSTDLFARYDPVLGAILARWPGSAAPPSGDVVTVNGATFRSEDGISAGSLAAGFGAFSVTPDEVQVSAQDARVLAASASQVNFLVPAVAPLGTVAVSVRAGGSEIARGQATVTATSPGVFALNPLDPSEPGAVLNQDSTVNTSANPAAQGSVVQIFATGYGPLDASGQAAVQVFIGETPAAVLYSAPVPQIAGLWQINARTPQTGSGQTALFLIAGNTAGNGVTIWLK
jgi:uncharacterized protein (TIGR03437 family)